MKHTIELDDYEVANLRSAIEAIGYRLTTEQKVIPHSPLMVLNTGDWLGQIYQKLPVVKRSPNLDPVELACRAKTQTPTAPFGNYEFECKRCQNIFLSTWIRHWIVLCPHCKTRWSTATRSEDGVPIVWNQVITAEDQLEAALGKR